MTNTRDQRTSGARTDVDKAFLDNATYRSLGEQSLSPHEEAFEKGRRTLGLVLAPIVTVTVLLIPFDLPDTQHTLAAVLLGVVVLWVTEPVPIPIGGFIGVGAVVLLGVATADEALAPFGSSTVFTFIGAFILAQAMLKHGLAKRFAMFILGLPGVGRSTFRVVIAFGAVTAVLSAFVSNTATVAMLLPTAIGLLTVIAKLMQAKGVVAEDFDPLRLRVGVALMLMLAYGASVGGLLTPVGSPPNLIGRALIEEATGEKISFLDWMIMALPICALMFVGLAVVLIALNRPEIRRLEGVEEWVAEERKDLGRLSLAERNTLIAFVVTVALWITPGVVALLAGTESSAYATVGERLDEGVVAVIGASLLFLLPTDWGTREFTLRWSDAAQIDWGTVVLFGTGIIFGSLLESTGLAETIGNGSYNALGLGSTVRHHRVRGRAGDPDLRDDEQHRLGLGRGADHHPDRDRGRCRSVHTGAGGHVRGVVRLHAARLDAAERRGLRLRRRTHHQDDPVRDLLRRDRGDPDRPAAAVDGRRDRAGVSGARQAVDHWLPWVGRRPPTRSP